MSEDISHYKPKHPLPEEIQNLPRHDTVCKFCGVSYLIHNEIKRLEDKIQEYEKQIDRLQHFHEREEILEEEVGQLKLQSKELLMKWELEEQRYNELYTVSCGKDQTIDNLRAELFESTEEGKVLKNHTENLNQQRSELNVYIQNSVSAVKQDFQKLRDRCSRILTEQCDEMSVMKKLLAETFLQAQTFSNTSRDEILSQAHIEKQDLMNEFKVAKDQHIKQLNKLTMDQSSELATQLKIYQDKEKQIHREHNNKMQEYEAKNEDLSKSIDELRVIHTHDMKTSSEQIGNYQKEVSDLKESLKLLQASGSSDRQKLLNSIRSVEKENKELKEEKEKMIEAHQNRIQQLRESFIEKMKEAEKWPGKLEHELSVLKNQFDVEKSELRKKLADSYNNAALEKEKECDMRVKQERKTFQEQEQKLKSRLQSMQEKFQNEVGDLHDIMQKMKREKEDLIASSHKTVCEMERKFQSQLATKTQHDESMCTRRTQELQNVVQLADQEIRDKNIKLQEMEDKIQNLRDCVRRECEERFELTESLAQARTELLSMQRCYGNNNSLSKSMLPSPPAYGRKSSLQNYEHMNNSKKDLDRNGLPTPVLRRNYSSGSEGSTIGNYVEQKSKSSEQSRDRINVAFTRHSKNKLKLSLKSQNKTS